MVVANSANHPVAVNTARYNERTAGFTNARNIFTGEVIKLSKLTVDGEDSDVYELIK